MQNTAIDILNKTLSKFTSEDKRLVASTMAKEVIAASFPAIRRVDLVLTECCNCCCTYCFEGEKSKMTMSSETLEKAIDFVFAESRGSEEVAFILFGGEPLVRFDLVEHAIKYANRKALDLGKRVRYEMTTNGTLLNKEIIDFGVANGLSYLLSLDGDRETHDLHRREVNGKGTYDRIVQWIPYLKEHQKWLGARVTPTPDTVHKLAANIRHLRSLRINQFLIGMAAGPKWSVQAINLYRQQWEEIADFYIAERNQGRAMRINDFELSWESLVHERQNEWGCSGGRSQIGIAPDGDIYPCPKFMTLINPFTGKRGAYRLGSLDEGLSNLNYRREVINSCQSCRIACLRCEFADVCLGTCLAVNYEENDSIFDCHGCLCEEKKIIYDLLRRRPDLCGASGQPMNDGTVGDSHFQPIGVTVPIK